MSRIASLFIASCLILCLTTSALELPFLSRYLARNEHADNSNAAPTPTGFSFPSNWTGPKIWPLFTTDLQIYGDVGVGHKLMHFVNGSFAYATNGQVVSFGKFNPLAVRYLSKIGLHPWQFNFAAYTLKGSQYSINFTTHKCVAGCLNGHDCTSPNSTSHCFSLASNPLIIFMNASRQWNLTCEHHFTGNLWRVNYAFGPGYLDLCESKNVPLYIKAPNATTHAGYNGFVVFRNYKPNAPAKFPNLSKCKCQYPQEDEQARY
jgi:hypothetical protein